MRARLLRLRRDERGASAVEFALIAPFMIGLVLGTMQLSLDVWAKSILTGAVQEAGRDSSIEEYHSDQKALDDRVTAQVHAFLPSARLSFERKNYENFTDVSLPEDFVDSNDNKKYDSGECFTDENGNGEWDADLGANGQGGARDVVKYTATMDYDELLPVSGFLGLGKSRKFMASTTLMNQPFSTQADRVTKDICPS